MFIVIKKIVSKALKDNEGKYIKDPISGKIKSDGMKVVQETIRIDEVKSAREYHNPKIYKDNGIDGGVSILYMKGNKGQESKLPEIYINETIASWNKRVGAVLLKSEK